MASRHIRDPRIIVQQLRGNYQQPWAMVEIPEEWVRPVLTFGVKNTAGFYTWQQSASSVSHMMKRALAVIQDTPTLLLTMGPEAVSEYEAAIAKLDRIAAQ